MATIGVDTPELTTDPRQWYSTAVFSTGYLYEWHGNHYWFAKVVDVAVTAGMIVEWSSTAGAVTADRAGGGSLGRNPAGVAIVGTPVGGYTFFQCSGLGTQDLTTDGSVAAGETLVPHATTNGGVDTMAAGSEEYRFGYALDADSSTTLAAGRWLFKECM